MPDCQSQTGTGKLQPGYFWLAGEWTNLLVSCPDCNRARKHEVPGQDKKVKLGKETQFPLGNEAFRLRTQGSLANEETVRLLLDPCSDQPEDHLTFNDDGYILARSDAHGQQSEKGKASITVFALQRKGLVEERQEVLLNLKKWIRELSVHIKHHNDLKSLNAGQQMLDDNASQIKNVMETVTKMFDPNAPYQAMLRDFIREGDKRGDFENLKQFKIQLTDLLKPL